MSARRVLVALNSPLPPLTYEVPPALDAVVQPGVLVEVPLATRQEVGCVVEEEGQDASLPLRFDLRPILRVVSEGYAVPEELCTLARWVSDYYFCSWGEALAAVSMVGFTDTPSPRRRAYAWTGIVPEALPPKQRSAAQALGTSGPGPWETLAEVGRAAGCSSDMVRKLLMAGVLREVALAVGPRTVIPPPDVPPELHPEQRDAVEAVDAARQAGRFEVFLLHGVTGSGKTEVYLRLIERALAAGQSALCLVPEIALTPQTVDRFARRFQRPVGVFHSQLSKGEKRALHEGILAGEIRLVIGARSASFAPFPNLGLIVIDEEHEGSYKQGETPRYHARDASIVRASRLRIPVVLGSATPSMESYENARRGKYRLLRLSSRPAGLLMPEVRIVSLAEQAAAPDPESGVVLSGPLRAAVRDRLDRGEQSLLFLNRRGFSNFLVCPSCRWTSRCDHDDIVMTVHRRGRPAPSAAPAEGQAELDLFPRPLTPNSSFLKCHFCGDRRDVPKVCPQCGHEELHSLGMGTQRAEEAVQRAFPDARILRLDQDSVGGRQGFLRAWNQMVSGEAQIILGTQMLAKGLHLERVTLVGVVLADVGLYLPDFRAEERTFHLLMQVAGRAGRVSPGEVLFQTWLPRHAAIQLAARHDYEGYFTAEMRRRARLRFPPVERLVALTLTDPDPTVAVRWARMLGTILERQSHAQRDGSHVDILGPQPAPIERLAGRWRQRLLLRAPTQRPSQDVLRRALADREWRPPSSLRLAVDVDPLDLL